MLKEKILILCLFLILVVGIGKTNALLISEFPLLNKIIYIDPGHGGVDPGAVYKELKESDINLRFAKEIGRKLELAGAEVFYTRIGDYDLSSTTNRRKKSDLSNRIKLINDSDADLYLSIHVNSEECNDWYGAQIFYTNINKQNEIVALSLQKQLKKGGVSKRKISVIKNTYMYDRINIAGVLLELGFISNYADREKLQDDKYVIKFTDLVVKGIVDYLNKT